MVRMIFMCCDGIQRQSAIMILSGRMYPLGVVAIWGSKLSGTGGLAGLP